MVLNWFLSLSHLSRVFDHDADLFPAVALGKSSLGIATVVGFAVVLEHPLQLVGDAGFIDLLPVADIALVGDDLVALLLDLAVDPLLDAFLIRVARLLAIQPPTVVSKLFQHVSYDLRIAFYPPLQSADITPVQVKFVG